VAGSTTPTASAVSTTTAAPSASTRTPSSSADGPATTVPVTVAPPVPVVPATSTEAAVPAPTAAPPAAPPPTVAAAPTTAPAPSVGAPAGSLDALVVLAGIPVANEHGAGYDRDLFAYGHDDDGDGCDTRAEVLVRDSLTPAQVDPVACTVVAGDWYSPYDGVTWSGPAELQIDHVVALKEAWDSGAYTWDAARRAAYGNDLADPRTLRAVTGSLNQAKGDKDPSNWMPPNLTDWCRYAVDWIAIKARWGMSMDQSEAGRLRNILTDRCPGATIAPWPPAGGATAAPSAPPVTAPAAPVVPAPPPSPEGMVGLDPQFSSCKQAKAAGYGPYVRGTDPEYDWYRDADSDGIVCE
jgi:hypothetical protein